MTLGLYLVWCSLPFIYRYQRRRQLKRAIANSLPRHLLTEFVPDEVLTNKEPQTVATLFAEYEQLRQLILRKMKQTTASETLKTDLLTNVSHDSRTPLTAIISYSDLLQATALETDEQQQYLAIIQEKAQRMNEMITDLFEVTKMDNGAVALNYENIDIVALIQQMIGEYSEEAVENRYTLRITYSQETIRLTIDANKIWRVLDNLLKNCMKYSLPESRIYLKVSETADGCRLVIKNISRYELDEDAPLLIERFKRGKFDEARQSDGYGLGLAIVASIINLHKGNLDISVDGDMFKVVIDLPKGPPVTV
ncbi:sensor histidine kinase [Brochothrix campestris]|uniref:sensor histidine kinase n=1 Tax=Brochothrix campestris TaxID=2757 RepID=UPI0026A858AA